MKKILLAAFLLLASVPLFSQIQIENPKYDKVLADSMGADQYGMKMYVLVILKTGPAKFTDKQVVDSLLRGHLANIGRLAGLNKLSVAGPLVKNDQSYRGIFILNVPTLEEANELLQTDPAIANHMFDVELFQWYGSAALPAYLPTHDKVVKVKM